MQRISKREIEQGSLEILKKIDGICRRLDLKYCLAYGTLLGAVRHKGFIPWDDDTDIMMPRKDYDILVDYFIDHKEELEPFEVVNPQVNEGCPYTISRISDSRYKLVMDNEDDFGMGLFVDIYPLDGAGRTVKEYRRLKIESCMYASMCFVSTRQKIKRDNTRSNLKMALKYPAFAAAKILGKKFFMNHLYKMAGRYDYDSSSYVGCIIWASDDGLKAIFPKEWLEEMIDVEFEGNYFMAPKEYDRMLSQIYGEYMELPPEKDRGAHHSYEAYRKIER